MYELPPGMELQDFLVATGQLMPPEEKPVKPAKPAKDDAPES